jgi:hypothetical protein
MSLIPRYIGINETLEAFNKKARTPFFSLWDKTQCITQYNGDDIGESESELREEIETSIKRNYDHPLTLRLHPTKEKNYTLKSETNAVIVFLCQDKPAFVGNTGGNDYNNYVLLNQINALKSEIEALKVQKLAEDDEDEEDDDDGASTLISGVNQLLDHPVVMGLINKWVNGTQPVTHLAGVDNKSIEECINILFSKGVTVEHLQKLADMDKAKIKMLLTML